MHEVTRLILRLGGGICNGKYPSQLNTERRPLIVDRRGQIGIPKDVDLRFPSSHNLLKQHCLDGPTPIWLPISRHL